MTTTNAATPATEHTPGPWKLELVGDGKRWILGPNQSTWGSYVGEVNRDDIDREEAEANARLIVAAPDLLAFADHAESCAINFHCALQSTAHMDPNDSRIHVITGQVVTDLQHLAAQARAAIARARNVNPL